MHNLSFIQFADISKQVHTIPTHMIRLYFYEDDGQYDCFVKVGSDSYKITHNTYTQICAAINIPPSHTIEDNLHE